MLIFLFRSVIHKSGTGAEKERADSFQHERIREDAVC